MKVFRQFLAVVVITLIASHTAFAGIPNGGGGGAPEIDPAMGMGALGVSRRRYPCDSRPRQVLIRIHCFVQEHQIFAG